MDHQIYRLDIRMWSFLVNLCTMNLLDIPMAHVCIHHRPRSHQFDRLNQRTLVHINIWLLDLRSYSSNLVHKKCSRMDDDSHFQYLELGTNNVDDHHKSHFRDNRYLICMLRLWYNEHLDLDLESNLLGKHIRTNRLCSSTMHLGHIDLAWNIHQYLGKNKQRFVNIAVWVGGGKFVILNQWFSTKTFQFITYRHTGWLHCLKIQLGIDMKNLLVCLYKLHLNRIFQTVHDWCHIR